MIDDILKPIINTYHRELAKVTKWAVENPWKLAVLRFVIKTGDGEYDSPNKCDRSDSTTLVVSDGTRCVSRVLLGSYSDDIIHNNIVLDLARELQCMAGPPSGDKTV